MTNLEKLPATIDPAVAAAMLVPERLNNQSLHAEAIQNAIFQRVRARLVADGKGQPREVIENYRSVLAEDPQLRGHIRLNLLTDRVDIVGDIGWQRECSALTDTDVQYLLWYCERNYQLGNEKKLRAALAIVANENSYHPIRQALESLSWDGKSRIRDCLHHFLGAEVSDYVEEVLRHFLLGAIKRVFEPGCKYEEMLCLVGGQGAGKSSFFRLLSMKDEWFSDDLKRLDDDKVYAKLQGHWIIEMSEMLATSSAKSIEEIRSFISRQKETYRTPYEAQPKDRPRQCVCGGSANSPDVLPPDRAGNQRFLPVMVHPDRAEVHILENESDSRLYLAQLWAEAMTLYKTGDYSMKFSPAVQKQLKTVQLEFMPEDTIAGQIEGWLESYKGDFVCSKQLYREALGKSFADPSRWDLHNIREVMNEQKDWVPFNGVRYFRFYGKQRGWERCGNKEMGTKNEPNNIEQNRTSK